MTSKDNNDAGRSFLFGESQELRHLSGGNAQVELCFNPVGSYYYSWEGGRWTSDKEHVFAITAFVTEQGGTTLRCLGRLNMPQEAFFHIHSSRKSFNEKKRKESEIDTSSPDPNVKFQKEVC